MREPDKNLVMELAASVSCPIIGMNEFFYACTFDAGHDFTGTGLVLADLKNVWNDETDGIDWASVGFFADELLAFYAAWDHPLPSKFIPRWVFTALLVRDAIEHEYSDWGFQENKIAMLFEKSEQITDQQKQQIVNLLGHTPPAHSVERTFNEKEIAKLLKEARQIIRRQKRQETKLRIFRVLRGFFCDG